MLIDYYYHAAFYATPPTSSTNGYCAIGLSGVGGSVKVASQRGTCQLGIAATGTVRKRATPSGTAASGITTSAVAKKIRSISGVSTITIHAGSTSMVLTSLHSSSPSADVSYGVLSTHRPLPAVCATTCVSAGDLKVEPPIRLRGLMELFDRLPK